MSEIQEINYQGINKQFNSLEVKYNVSKFLGNDGKVKLLIREMIILLKLLQVLKIGLEEGSNQLNQKILNIELDILINKLTFIINKEHNTQMKLNE